MAHVFKLVSVALAGYLTFECRSCGFHINQLHNDVWADVAGPVWYYYCTDCKEKIEAHEAKSHH